MGYMVYQGITMTGELLGAISETEIHKIHYLKVCPVNIYKTKLNQPLVNSAILHSSKSWKDGWLDLLRSAVTCLHTYEIPYMVPK